MIYSFVGSLSLEDVALLGTDSLDWATCYALGLLDLRGLIILVAHGDSTDTKCPLGSTRDSTV